MTSLARPPTDRAARPADAEPPQRPQSDPRDRATRQPMRPYLRQQWRRACAEVRQALREIGRDGLAEGLCDGEIIEVLAAQARLLDKALASGYVDEVELGGVRVDRGSGPAQKIAYVVQAARDRLAFGRGWLAAGLTPPWRQAGDPDAAAAMARAAVFWLARLLDGVGVPDGWTSQDTLRWLVSEREHVARKQASASDLRQVERLGWLGALLAEAERDAVRRHRTTRPHRVADPHRPAGERRPDSKRGNDAT
ncbi:MAG TPA: hypothetical protein VFA45_22945, partial [Actinomycetes bacterium]|nr:hypothetical protein [Actinomycetes bacterium]